MIKGRHVEGESQGRELRLFGNPMEAACVITTWTDVGDGKSQKSFVWRSKFTWVRDKKCEAVAQQTRLISLFEGREGEE